MPNLSAALAPASPSQSIYALLVGIDDYTSPVPPLRGCVNDITALETYLKDGIAQLHLLKLTNQAATRQAIIDGFRQHLRQAGEQDIVLFAYSGHGSQEAAAPEFWHLEPDHLNETLVCYDSRTDGNWDLADKELDQLIAEVANKCPHTVIILDCCHSGSGTRTDFQEIAVRRASTNYCQRPLSSYVLAPEVVAPAQSPKISQSGWELSQGRHILLAACRDSQTAKEYRIDGQHRGAFSYFLLNTLRQTNGRLTYRDLFKQTSSLVESSITQQSPQLETAYPEDLQRFFLNNALADFVPYFTLSMDKQHGWMIDGGAVHGIPQPTQDETTMLAVFPDSSTPQQLRDSSASIAKALVIQVLPQLSKVLFDWPESLDAEASFKAVLTSLPIPRLDVCLQGETQGVKLLSRSLLSVAPDGEASLYVRQVSHQSSEMLRVLARNGQYLITRPADDLPIVMQVEEYTEQSAHQVIERLEHIARWYNILNLSNVPVIQLPADAVQLDVFDQNGEFPTRLEYTEVDGTWTEPTFTLRLKNNSEQPLHCAVLNLTERFAVTNLFESGGVWLQPGQEVWALGRKPLHAQVPRELWQQGMTELKDVLKLIVSTAAFDARLLEQPKLDLPRIKPEPEEETRSVHPLDRLMRHIQWRDIGSGSEFDTADTWITSQVTITTVRPQNAVPISVAKEALLGFGVKVQPHQGLQAQVRLTTVTQAGRDLGNLILPAVLREHPAIVQLLQFTPSRGSDPGLSAIELSRIAVNTSDTVTAQNPLSFLIDADLAENEQVLPIAFDGEFFLPLGRSQRTDSGELLIWLERLPTPVCKGQRDPNGSIYIFLPKVTSQNVNLSSLYPSLQDAIQSLVSLDELNLSSQRLTFQTWATIALAIELNNLSTIGLSMDALLSLLRVISTVDDGLDKIYPYSELLQLLSDDTQLEIPFAETRDDNSLTRDSVAVEQIKRLCSQFVR